MTEVEIPVPPAVSLDQLSTGIEAICAGLGLAQTLTGTLSRFPGSRHWHFKNGREAGTLEITLWPGQRRLWLKVARGREGPWMATALPRLRDALASHMLAPGMVDDLSGDR
jgi:hypothetical protein